MTAVNHEGETSSAWQMLKAKLKLLLTAPQVLSAAFDEGVKENVAAERRLIQDVQARIEQRRSVAQQTAGQPEEAT